jgi:hypothetical protein
MMSVSGNRLAGDALREVLRTFRSELQAAVSAGDPAAWATSARCQKLHDDLLWGPTRDPVNSIYRLTLCGCTRMAVDELVTALFDASRSFDSLARSDHQAFLNRTREILVLLATLAVTAAVELTALGLEFEADLVGVYDLCTGADARLVSSLEERQA